MKASFLDFDEASTIYAKTMKRLGYRPDSPCSSTSYYDKGIWYFYNINGFLGKVGCKAKRLINPPEKAY